MLERRLTGKTIFFSGQTFWLLVAFFAIRFFSYQLVGHEIYQSLIVFILIMILGIFFFKNQDWAWCLVIGEIFIGGSGHTFEFLGLSLRTLLILFFVFLWFTKHIGDGSFKEKINLSPTLLKLVTIFSSFLLLASFVGLYNQHPIQEILQDLMPFLFLGFIFPSYHLFKNNNVQEFLVRSILVFVIGSCIFSLFNFFVFSSGLAVIHDAYYSWLRDVMIAKITDMGNGFYRIVEPTHMLLVPIILFISSLLMKDEKHHKMWRVIIILALITLVLNLSRGFFLALFVGLLVLKFKHKWKRWFIVSATTCALIILIFSSLSLLVSRGTTMGMELLGIRLTSISNPQIEVSSATRMMLLPEILSIIQYHPILGIGLGSSVTFYDTSVFDLVTTRQYDWGYLEMIAEFGIFGFISFFVLVFYTLINLIKKILHYEDFHDPEVGLLAGLVSFLIMNITAPAMSHVFGIIFLSFILTLSTKPAENHDDTITLIYRIFNKQKISA